MSRHPERSAGSRLLTLLFFFALLSCVEQPGVGEGNARPAFRHELAGDNLSNCSSCHDGNRPAPKENHPHGGGKQCSTCHTPKDNNSGWLPRNSYSHNPKPESCLDCHVQDRPKRTSHPTTGDCVGCHNFPSFK